MRNQFHLIIALILVTMNAIVPSVSFGHSIYTSKEEFYGQSDLIVVGKILSYDDDKTDRRYQIEVKEYVKKTSQFENIKKFDVFGCNPHPPAGTVIMDGGCQTFEKGQEVFFGLNERHDKRLYMGDGFVVQNPGCTGKQLLEAVERTSDFRIIQNNKTTSKMFSGIKTDLVYDFISQDLFSKNITLGFHVRHSSDRIENETFSDTKQVLIPDCTRNTVISTSFIPKKTGTYEICAKNDDETLLCYGGMTVVDKIDSPLKQSKSGIPVEKITCGDGHTLMLKAHTNTPVCIKNSSILELHCRNFVDDVWNASYPICDKVVRNHVAESPTNYREIKVLSVSPDNVTLPDPKPKAPAKHGGLIQE